MSRTFAKVLAPAAFLVLLVGAAATAPPDPRADLVFREDVVGTLLLNKGTRTIFVEVRIDAYVHESGAPAGGGITAAYIEPGGAIFAAVNRPGIDNELTITLAEYRAKPPPGK